jgi:hypothetical protein
MADDRYTRVTFHGVTVDKYTMMALRVAEHWLGYELTIIQGSYHKGVGSSAGTHDGGGVIDLAPYAWRDKVRVLRCLGFAAWHRTTAQGNWAEHVHAVQYKNAKLSPAAAQQITAYLNGRDGLVGNRPDDGPRITLVAFPYHTVT